MIPAPTGNPALHALRGPFLAPDAWARILRMPGSPGQGVLELAWRLCQGAQWTILAHTDSPALAAAAAAGAQAGGAQLYLTGALPLEALSDPSLTERVAPCPVPPLTLLRSTPIRPSLVLIDRLQEVEALLPWLAANAIVLCPQDAAPPSGLSCWAGTPMYFAPPSNTDEAGLRESDFADARQALADAQFDRVPNAQPGPPGDRPPGPWPSRFLPGAPLPPTLPDGSPWPKISIVTPSFNQGRYLEDTILSVAHQQYPNVEHIVMDGGSTDETSEVLARHRHRLAAAVSEPDRGQSHAINKGMALTTGEILTWLNSDDLLAPGALAAMALAFHTSRADLVAGIACLFSGPRFTDLHLTSCEPGPLPLDDLLDLDGCWNAGQFFYQPEVLFTREAWRRAGGMVREDLFYSMDYDLWVRMAETGARLHVIGRPICWFRQHVEQKTHATAKFRAELEQYRLDYLDRRPMPSRAAPPAAPKRSLRIAMVNDVGFHYGAGLAHQRLAEAAALAGHTVVPLTLASAGSEPPTPGTLTQAVADHRPDLVITGNFHGAGATTDHLQALSGRFPTFVVLHDMWPLTGRCGFSGDCVKYLTGCDHTCPTASEYPALPLEQIRPAWEAKKELYNSAHSPVLLGNSAWTTSIAIETLAAWGVAQPMHQTGSIRYGFPVDRLIPYDKLLARRLLGLPEDRFIVLLSGELNDRRKRIRESFEALAQAEIPDLTAVWLGNPGTDVPFPVKDVRKPGFVSDPDRVAIYKAAADVFLSGSLEETLGQVFVEAAACGTPAIGYRRTGVMDAIRDGVSGVLLDDTEPAALARTIEQLYRDPGRRAALGAWGRIYTESEWSLPSAYHTLFCAWRRTGLAERLGIAPKISFRPEAAPAFTAQPARRLESVWIEPELLGGQEGPLEEFDLPRFRWAFGPVSRLSIHAPAAGTHSLVLLYRNPHARQTLGIRVNGHLVRSYKLAQNRMACDRAICTAITLERGDNVVELEFNRWRQTSNDPRPLAVILTGIHCLPDPV